jgi:hypothetical protein
MTPSSERPPRSWYKWGLVIFAVQVALLALAGVSPSRAASVPPAPAAPTATPGSGQATVKWKAPAGSGSPIKSYTVTSYSGSTTVSTAVLGASARTVVVSGLVNGRAYTFKVAAQNGVGLGPNSAASTPVTVGAPTSPGKPSPTPGNNAASVSWPAPSSSNASPITGYVVTPYVNGSALGARSFTSTARSQTITGLSNGQSVSFTVAARNSYGTSPSSASSNAITVGVPTAPRAPSAIALDASADLVWQPPASGGGGAITGYNVGVYVGSTMQTSKAFDTATHQIVGGLTNGVVYSFRISARNGFGSSSDSTATKKVMPVSAANRTVLWSAGMEGGGLSEWTANAGGDFENSGVASASATASIAHSGAWSLKATIDTASGSSGVRAFRWAEPRTNRDAYYSVWLYIPTPFTLTGQNKWWNVFQFKSRTADNSRVDPLWAFYLTQDAGGVYVQAGWGWGGTTLTGPYAGSNASGKWYAPRTKVYVPIGRWVHLEAFLHQSKDFDGSLKFWQDGTLLFDLANIRTSYPNCNFNAWCADNEWSVNLYSDGMSPNPATAYFDDAVISR